ncbi:MAG: hypothetical protein HYZ40_19810, partial [Rhodospirillales bacterium]|nr:hypothetical protein [Rhodospirillales bacterium]
LSLRQGAIAPWGRRPSPFHVALLAALARALRFDLDTPFADLPADVRKAILSGTGSRATPEKHGVSGRMQRSQREMRKSQWNKAYLGIPDTGPDNTRYIWVSGNNGRKARRYWLSGVREPKFGCGTCPWTWRFLNGADRPPEDRRARCRRRA